MADLIVGVLLLSQTNNLELILGHPLLLRNSNTGVQLLLIPALGTKLGLVDRLRLSRLVSLELHLMLLSQLHTVWHTALLADVSRRLGTLLEATKRVLVARLRTKSGRWHKF